MFWELLIGVLVISGIRINKTIRQSLTDPIVSQQQE